LEALNITTAAIESELPQDDLEKTLSDLERLDKRMDKCLTEQGAQMLMTWNAINQ
jgi:hypothetical protein